MRLMSKTPFFPCAGNPRAEWDRGITSDSWDTYSGLALPRLITRQTRPVSTLNLMLEGIFEDVEQMKREKAKNEVNISQYVEEAKLAEVSTATL